MSIHSFTSVANQGLSTLDVDKKVRFFFSKWLMVIGYAPFFMYIVYATQLSCSREKWNTCQTLEDWHVWSRNKEWKNEKKQNKQQNPHNALIFPAIQTE